MRATIAPMTKLQPLHLALGTAGLLESAMKWSQTESRWRPADDDDIAQERDNKRKNKSVENGSNLLKREKWKTPSLLHNVKKIRFFDFFPDLNPI